MPCALARAFSSDTYLAVALGVAAAALASALLLLLTILLLRAWRRWRAWRLARLEGGWRDAMHLALEAPRTTRLPRIAAIDLPDFVIAWNHFQESLRGRSADNLALLIRRHGIDDRLLALLERRSLRLRLIAITALGHLQERRAWDALARLARDPGGIVSFAAARALLRIDPPQALKLLASSLVRREDWSLARIGSIFQELGPAVVTEPLVELLVSRPRRGLERLLRLSRFGHRDRVGAIVRGWLSVSSDPEVLIAGLDYLEEGEDLPLARGAARHADWAVRTAAARALGRLGAGPELPLLLDLLRDPVWWVRYRAAEAILRLPGIGTPELEALRDGARDGYAAEMLAQALAERGRA